MQKFSIGGNILHGSAVMGKTDVAFGIHYTIQRHAPQLEQVDFLFVHSGNFMIGIRQTNERNFFIRPILLECRRRVRPDCQDRYIAADKFFVLITQARQLRAAIRSHESAQERKHNRLVPAKV